MCIYVTAPIHDLFSASQKLYLETSVIQPCDQKSTIKSQKYFIPSW